MPVDPTKQLKRRKPRTDLRGKPRPDGRLQMLVYLKPELIFRLKHAVIDDNTVMYHLVEDILREAMDSRDRRREGRSLETWDNAADVDPDGA
jgi:hypothetical protein